MNIINTGVSTSSTEKVKEVVNIIKRIYDDYREKVKKSGIPYGNLFEFVQKKYSEQAVINFDTSLYLIYRLERNRLTEESQSQSSEKQSDCSKVTTSLLLLVTPETQL